MPLIRTFGVLLSILLSLLFGLLRDEVRSRCAREALTGLMITALPYGLFLCHGLLF
ncbi:MAG: hypothetical protein ACK5L0_07445 [Candidatus Fimivivens sp.]